VNPEKTVIGASVWQELRGNIGERFIRQHLDISVWRQARGFLPSEIGAPLHGLPRLGWELADYLAVQIGVASR
jgi:hypothetical protein